LTAQLAWRGRDGAFTDKLIAHYRRHGCAEDAIEAFRRRGNQYPTVVPTVAPEFRAVRAGDVIPIGDRRWEVIVVHGHAPEHACLWSPDDAVLISGDQVLPKITTNVSIWPDQPRANPLRLYLDSLSSFRAMAAETLVLPSHGLPFRGLHARIEMLRTHHDARLAETMQALDRPRTGCELVPMLFRRALDTHQLGFAIGEVLAHLHLLEAEGTVARLSDDGVERFERTRS
jgi:glyoxylase-like metal-dependent hydrolase (beta-lactamase superfamily II)